MGKGGKQKGVPKAALALDSKRVKQAVEPESYLQKKPVWRFGDFDWDGPYGLAAVAYCADSFVGHIRSHLSNYETMTWAEILKATGGRSHGNNSHEIRRNLFKREVQQMLTNKGIHADTLFSLRLDAGTRIYGVRYGEVLNLVFFDPFHKEHDKCAYQFKS